MIPAYLDIGEPVFIRLAAESQAPKRGNSAKDGPFYRITDTELISHIQEGGNVGRVFRDEIIGIDVDHRILLDELEDWPETFVVESGGSDLGYHYYYRVPTYDQNQTELTDDQRNIGSVRSGNTYCVCPPSIHPDSGNRYTVKNSQEVTEISISRLTDLIEKYGPNSSSETANTAAGGGRGAGGASASIPDEYPNREATWTTMKKWLSANGLLSDLDKTACSDWSGLEFKLAKCLAEGGFSDSSISDALDRLHRNSKWWRRGSDYRELTVQKAIEAAVDDPYVDYTDTADMTGNTVERRKTDSGVLNPRKAGGDSQMVDFNEQEAVLAKESDGEGATAVKAVKVEGQDGDDEFEFVSLRKGSLRERETADGDTALVVDIDDTSGKSVGSPGDLDVVIDALEQLKDELE